MAGHGFKFSTVVGAIGADLALEGKTAFDIRLFDPARLPALAAA
jgi:glycine/D-amino acid oxidase-like deaminating enzyme